MAHKEQKDFCKWVRRQHPKFFSGTVVIDVGSLDINGSNRYLFKGFLNPCTYLGIDLAKGKNVDIIGRAHEALPNISEHPDVIISTECLEHDCTWEATLSAMYTKLSSGGLLIITAAGEGREEHGTASFHSWCSPATNDYYRNITNEMFASILRPDMFSEYYLAQDKRNCDLNFMGIKI